MRRTRSQKVDRAALGTSISPALPVHERSRFRRQSHFGGVNCFALLRAEILDTLGALEANFVSSSFGRKTSKFMVPGLLLEATRSVSHHHTQQIIYPSWRDFNGPDDCELRNHSAAVFDAMTVMTPGSMFTPGSVVNVR
jgi:hypothetical protein